MKIPKKSKSYVKCPPFIGKAVIVDVTPLRKLQSQYGERDAFNFVKEVDLKQADGTPYTVWSKPFTLSLDEKSNLRKSVRGLLGRDLTQAEVMISTMEPLTGAGRKWWWQKNTRMEKPTRTSRPALRTRVANR